MYKPPKQLSPAALQKQVDDFNASYTVGETVNVRTDDGTTVTDTIRYPASIMGGHTAMAWLEGKGSYKLDRVSKL